MQWLTALLAFAVTMLMFAIFVSTLVEMVHRIFHLRALGMRLMLENLYNRVIKPKLTAEGGAAPEAKDFASIIMENRAAMPRDHGDDNILKKFLRWFVDWAVVTDMPVEVFTQKLADNRIVGNAAALTDEVIKDIAQKYEAFCAEVGAYFESRARLLSVLIAFAVAWFFYVHPYKLAVTYFKNPEIAQAVADQAADVQAEYAVLVEKLNAAAAEPDDGNPEGTAELKTAIDDLKKELDDAQKQTDDLRKLGAPVGWAELKSCQGLGSVDCSWEVLGDSVTIPIPSYVNAFWLLVGGLLVGLGAPFWAQAVSSLTASRDITRRIAAIVTPERSADQAAVAPAGTPTTAMPTPVAAFKVANEAGRNT